MYKKLQSQNPKIGLPVHYTFPANKYLGGSKNLQINRNFEKLEEALSIAERTAREAVEMRAAMAKRLTEKEKETSKKQLMKLAQIARIDRAEIRHQPKNDIKRERNWLRHRQVNVKNKKAVLDRKFKKNRSRGRIDTQNDQRLLKMSKGLHKGFRPSENKLNSPNPLQKYCHVTNSVYRPSEITDNGKQGNLVYLTLEREFVNTDIADMDDKSRKQDGPVQFDTEDDEDLFDLDEFLKTVKRA